MQEIQDQLEMQFKMQLQNMYDYFDKKLYEMIQSLQGIKKEQDQNKQEFRKLVEDNFKEFQEQLLFNMTRLKARNKLNAQESGKTRITLRTEKQNDQEYYSILSKEFMSKNSNDQKSNEQFFCYSNSHRPNKYREDENENKINLFEIQEYSEKQQRNVQIDFSDKTLKNIQNNVQESPCVSIFQTPHLEKFLKSSSNQQLAEKDCIFDRLQKIVNIGKNETEMLQMDEEGYVYDNKNQNVIDENGENLKLNQEQIQTLLQKMN